MKRQPVWERVIAYAEQHDRLTQGLIDLAHARNRYHIVGVSVRRGEPSIRIVQQ